MSRDHTDDAKIEEMNLGRDTPQTEKKKNAADKISSVRYSRGYQFGALGKQLRFILLALQHRVLVIVHPFEILYTRVEKCREYHCVAVITTWGA